MTMNGNSLKDVYVEELKDLHSAETQIIDALPKMEQAASSQEVKQAFRQHLDMTRQQQKRLEQIFDRMQEKPGGKKCVGMEGIIREGQEILQKNWPAEVKDAALIAAAQKVEHYEIAGYGTVATYADMMGESDASRLLKQTLDEEERTDELLTKIAETHINKQAMRR